MGWMIKNFGNFRRFLGVRRVSVPCIINKDKASLDSTKESLNSLVRLLSKPKPIVSEYYNADKFIEVKEEFTLKRSLTGISARLLRLL